MRNKISLLVLLAFASFSCTFAQKKEFSKEALESRLVANGSSETAFKDILEKHKGKTTVIEIWASWCSDCVKAMPKLKELQKNNPNVDYVFISMDKNAAKWIEGINQYALNGDHYWSIKGMKSDFSKAIDLDWIPRYIIIDKTGKIVTYRAIETDFDKMSATLKTLK